jgi:hypothetical protein
VSTAVSGSPDTERDSAIFAALKRALETGEPESVAGPLREFELIYQSIEHHVLRNHRMQLIARAQRVAHCDERSASVEFDGYLDVVAKWWTGKDYEARSRISGPIELVFLDGDWKVTDFLQNALPVTRTLLPALGTASRGSVHGAVLAGLAGLASVVLYLELENELNETVRIRRGAVATPRVHVPGWRWKRAAVPLRNLEHGSTRIAIAADVHASLTDPTLRVLLDTSAGRLDIGPPSASTARVGPWIAWHGLLVFEALMLLLAGLALIGGGTVAAALILLSVAAITFSPGARNLRHSLLWKVYGAALVGLGGALLVWDKLLT